ncbi:hypothetical protein DXG03_000556 [Asterophora parasitica]|uniref:XPG-I domain-containing protein n=1 Tax=Asterophora parasitica TaxID=117018 RepID=A0A9P7K9N8_9AGAR|nr:hypothetical protein DXG03_000556 [Asterophora parasitica]
MSSSASSSASSTTTAKTDLHSDEKFKSPVSSSPSKEISPKSSFNKPQSSKSEDVLSTQNLKNRALSDIIGETFPPFDHQTNIVTPFNDEMGRDVVFERDDSDGTLITQRFHFAQAPHRYRHVLGWYKLINELRDAGVSAVCVFDGKYRNMAKAREAERRKEMQRKTSARGALEHDRSQRLRKLYDTLHKFRKLDSTARERAASLLRQLSLEDEAVARKPPESISQQVQAPLIPTPPYTLSAPQGPRLPADDETFASHFIAEEVLESALEEGPLGLFSAAHDAHYYALDPYFSVVETTHPFEEPDPTLFADVVYLSLDIGDDVYTHVSPVHVDELPQPSIIAEPAPFLQPVPVLEPVRPEDDVLAHLSALYLDYRHSVSNLYSLMGPLAPSLPITSGADPDTQADIVMTKAQYQLTLEEGGIWDTLSTEPDASSTEIEMEESALAKLSRTSDIMLASFERRTNPPRRQTYDESKEVLRAMGVPCLDAEGPFEAEALASSMVLNGLADYVASEDTDVIVYEAPLVRNLTSRNVPLTVVSGAEVRSRLQLDRASFVDFVLLLGTDFSQRIKNVGPARALKFIREHGSIERVIELEKKYIPRIPHDAYLEQVEIARTVFDTLPPVPKQSLLEEGVYDEAEIMQLLQKYNLGRAAAAIGYEWDYNAALGGNYFGDNPSAL